MAENCPLRKPLFLSVCFICCLQPLQLAAQTDLGAIRGHIQDQRGGAITSATITVRNDATAWQRTTESDYSGDYTLTGVPLTGQYTVSATAPQFKPAQEDKIHLRLGYGVRSFQRIWRTIPRSTSASRASRPIR
jgi:hypothetical protein